uniref:PEST proteolytic signal-containing nuclear protein n=1 Tax=Rhabditophanes sp. KR3021 TaxID=114890 RepID=A0AC35TTR1_9BILA
MQSKVEIAEKMKQAGHGKAMKVSGMRVNRPHRNSSGDKNADTGSDEELTPEASVLNAIPAMQEPLKKELQDQVMTKNIPVNIPKNENIRVHKMTPVFQPMKQN